jgi:hypothetical protein
MLRAFPGRWNEVRDTPRGARGGIKRRRHLDDRAMHVGAASRVANALFREFLSQLASRESCRQPKRGPIEV